MFVPLVAFPLPNISDLVRWAQVAKDKPSSTTFLSGMMLETRAELHMGICRRCFGTGMVRPPPRLARLVCPDCSGEGCSA